MNEVNGYGEHARTDERLAMLGRRVSRIEARLECHVTDADMHTPGTFEHERRSCQSCGDDVDPETHDARAAIVFCSDACETSFNGGLRRESPQATSQTILNTLKGTGDGEAEAQSEGALALGTQRTVADEAPGGARADGVDGARGVQAREPGTGDPSPPAVDGVTDQAADEACKASESQTSGQGLASLSLSEPAARPEEPALSTASQSDQDRALEWITDFGKVYEDSGREGYDLCTTDVANLIRDIRRETVEACAVWLDNEYERPGAFPDGRDMMRELAADSVGAESQGKTR